VFAALVMLWLTAGMCCQQTTIKLRLLLLLLLQMLVVHNGQPFNNITKPAPGMQLQPCSPGGSIPTAPAASSNCDMEHSISPVNNNSGIYSYDVAGKISPGRLVSTQQQQAARTAGSPQHMTAEQKHWQHNKHTGTFFSKHLKQAF
jgi:hypothetical protein